jgi:hypothetical protein
VPQSFWPPMPALMLREALSSSMAAGLHSNEPGYARFQRALEFGHFTFSTQLAVKVLEASGRKPVVARFRPSAEPKADALRLKVKLLRADAPELARFQRAGLRMGTLEACVPRS